MTPVSITSATPHDIPALVQMIRDLAEFERLSHLCTATDDHIERALFGPDPSAEVVLVRENSAIAGFALFFHNFSTFLGRRGLYLEDLYVQPAFRRKGYGRALLVHLAKLAVERDCGRFEWSVLEWNAPAIDFYQSLGATVMPDWRITRVTGPALDCLAQRGTLAAEDLPHLAHVPDRPGER